MSYVCFVSHIWLCLRANTGTRKDAGDLVSIRGPLMIARTQIKSDFTINSPTQAGKSNVHYIAHLLMLNLHYMAKKCGRLTIILICNC